MSANVTAQTDEYGDFADALVLAQEFLDRDFDDISFDEMPAEWTWENVNGVDFVPPV